MMVILEDTYVFCFSLADGTEMYDKSLSQYVHRDTVVLALGLTRDPTYARDQWCKEQMHSYVECLTPFGLADVYVGDLRET